MVQRHLTLAVQSMESKCTSGRPRRFAVLQTGHATEQTEQTHGGYGRILERLLHDREAEAAEIWHIFSVIDGDFSFMNRDGGCFYDAYVVTGSSADAHATDVEWINRLSDVLGILHCRRRRLLGICFGHQILARALGGETGRADVGWELGVKSLQVDSEKLSLLYGLTSFPSTISAIEIHRDQVCILPPAAVLLASSDRTKIEMFAVEDNVLCMQFHPEFTEDKMADILPALFDSTSRNDLVSEALESFKTGPADQALLQLLCKTFLKRCL